MSARAAPDQREELPLLVLRGLGHRYGGEHAVEALVDVSFAVHPGELVSVVGPSGCGKSTLLAAVAGLLPSHNGQIAFRGQALREPHPEIGVVFQEDATFPWRTARRNVEFGLEMRGVGRSERRRRADEMLRIVGLEGFCDHHPGQLSGGMKQRVAIARTLVTEPALLLMDEPFGALDEQTRLLLGEELLRLQQELDQTVLFVTHSIQESVLLSDRIVLMTRRPGRIKAMVRVDLPRPRGADLMGSPEFNQLVAQVWASIREESTGRARVQA